MRTTKRGLFRIVSAPALSGTLAVNRVTVSAMPPVRVKTAVKRSSNSPKALFNPHPAPPKWLWKSWALKCYNRVVTGVANEV